MTNCNSDPDDQLVTVISVNYFSFCRRYQLIAVTDSAVRLKSAHCSLSNCLLFRCHRLSNPHSWPLLARRSLVLYREECLSGAKSNATILLPIKAIRNEDLRRSPAHHMLNNEFCRRISHYPDEASAV